MKTRREEDAAKVFWRRESFGRLPRGEWDREEAEK